MKVKEGVILEGLKIEILEVMPLIDRICKSQVNKEMTVTEGMDTIGRKKTSLHHLGYAIDIRIRDLTSWQIADLTAIIVKSLKLISQYYDIVLESDHIHIEYDIYRRDSIETSTQQI